MNRTSTRRGATRLRLYEAAVTLIAEQGFSSTTVEQIAERAGVAKGTVYYNFSSKTELFEGLLRHGVGPLTVSLREAARASAAHGDDTVRRLEAMADAGLDFVIGHPDFARLLVAEQWRTNRSWHGTLVDVRRQVAGVVEDVLQEGVKRGELSEDLDIQLIAGAMVGMVVVAALDWHTFHAERPQGEVRSAVSLLLRGGLGAGGQVGPPSQHSLGSPSNAG
ncbi:TetR/AcrR family transcriptional regulator [Streptomyces millisiae]|uniref:TetR/AcrR family transcriptional regulator n=1 Tax=Streptomyces millisiae TaxID=3075542 RepID=A0ABU2M1G7_9ACTN|nr:TetR/AcrR family transcriptional regulator [Streptomyces sp. DSM 44918]MDT0323687.1 TetR/AcrR family transcriptional regulator [Streptomyces sp. DSM 44918]